MINPDDYTFFVPEEGGTRWIDNLAIPFDAPHPCRAHTFINWLYDGQEGANLSNWNLYGTPNAASTDFLDEDLGSFLSDASVVVGGPDFSGPRIRSRARGHLKSGYANLVRCHRHRVG